LLTPSFSASFCYILDFFVFTSMPMLDIGPNDRDDMLVLPHLSSPCPYFFPSIVSCFFAFHFSCQSFILPPLLFLFERKPPNANPRRQPLLLNPFVPIFHHLLPVFSYGPLISSAPTLRAEFGGKHSMIAWVVAARECTPPTPPSTSKNTPTPQNQHPSQHTHPHTARATCRFPRNRQVCQAAEVDLTNHPPHLTQKQNTIPPTPPPPQNNQTNPPPKIPQTILFPNPLPPTKIFPSSPPTLPPACPLYLSSFFSCQDPTSKFRGAPLGSLFYNFFAFFLRRMFLQKS